MEEESVVRSAAETRGRTAWAALQRLGIAHSEREGELRVHLVGADFVEASESAIDRLEPLVTRLATETRLTKLDVLLIGPNVPRDMHGKVLQADKASLRVTLRMECALYHECELVRAAPAALTLLFNAGIWGYDSWVPTLTLLHAQGVPVVVTSYNAWEADDDRETIQAAVPTWNWAWGPEPNPHASKRHRPSGIPGRTCADNHHWQAMTAQAPEAAPEVAAAAAAAATTTT